MKKISKILTLILCTLICAGTLSFANIDREVANADAADVIQQLEELFFSGDELSFRQYEGELTTLSPEGYDSGLTASTDLKEFILKIVNFALGFLGLIAVLMVIYGGVLYVIAAGEEERTQKGKKAIGYASIGLLIVLGSFAFVNTLIRGAIIGEEETGSTGVGVIGQNTGGSFNASAMEVTAIAAEIYNGFIFLAETTEELKNIMTDANKASLDAAYGAVAYNDMQSFIISVRGKLTNMQGKVPKFSNTYINLNEIIRYLDQENDELLQYKDTEWMPNLWLKIKADFDNPSGTLFDIFDPVRKDYLRNMEEQLAKLYDIRSELKGIEAIEQGSAGLLFTEMATEYGFATPEYEAYLLSSNVNDLKYNSGYMNKIQNFYIDKDVNELGNNLFKALQKQLDFAKAVGKLKSVEARLKANVISGNAPLVVRFDVLNSTDPAGGSIIDSNVIWDNITGKTTFEGEALAEDISLAAHCVKVGEGVTEDEFKENYGPAFRECTFEYPGTYVASVTINSNDPGEYVAGMSSLIIKVNPPNTKIELKMKTTSGDETIMSYYDNGLIKVNKDYVAVTLDEAAGGIAFDASATNNFRNFKWNFGNGETIEDDATGVVGEGDPDFPNFSEPGKYKIELEVMNKQGEIDRKIFTLDVRTVVARIKITPENTAFINQTITFDASKSLATNGTIKSYTWRIKSKVGNVFEEVDLGLKANEKTFTHQFKKPGKYTIDLEVTSDIDNKPINAEWESIEIISREPVALFDYDTPNKNQPATLKFDASKSYDPDGDSDNLSYEWTVEPAASVKFDNSDAKDKKPTIRFLEKGDYEVTLRVSDEQSASLTDIEYGEITKIITIDDILDIALEEGQQVTAILGQDGNNPGEALINFDVKSENGVAYEIDFGDHEQTAGKIDSKKTTVPHTYTGSGKYNVEITVFDEEDNDKSIQRTVFIGDDTLPIAKISLLINGGKVFDLNNIEVNRSDILTFDAGESRNVDGTGRKLGYSWNFGDTEKSSNKAATHSYDELSPIDPGYYEITLTVFDKDDPNLKAEDEINITVVNEPPTFSGIQALAVPKKGELITPVEVEVKVHGAEDKDGEIVQYKWWYYDVDDDTEPMGVQLTSEPKAKITIGTNGKEGYKIEYKFGVEIIDNDNTKVSIIDMLENDEIKDDQIPIKVTNGANELPTAKFKVDKTKIFVGEAVNFSSSSKDKDGEIKEYVWDFEGDGFFNNEATTKPTIEKVYDEVNLDGIDVKLKVIDDDKGESISDPITIYIDSNAKPPKAAFKYEVIQGSNGKKIKFKNNSTVDESAGAKVHSYAWDFDTNSDLSTADSDGDGKKDNDTDSQAKDPERLFMEYGEYKVKLTVTDNQGNTDDVTNTIKIPLANPPTAAFTYKVEDGIVKFKNNSKADTASQAKIVKYTWDFDTDSQLPTADSDGDGDKANDKNSDKKDPEYEYELPGLYNVKLTVKDDQGNEDEVVNRVNTTETQVTPDNENPEDAGGDGEIGTGIGPIPEGEELKAVFVTNPAPDEDGIIYLEGKAGSITFEYKDSRGPIAYYIFDKNIHFDTDGNGDTTDDEDFKTALPGTWKTNFEKAWGKIVVKLTVVDIYDNKDIITQEIKFK